MSRFGRSESRIERLVANSYKAINEGAYDVTNPTSHDSMSIMTAIMSCRHTPLITEIKFSSPSIGKIRDKEIAPAQIAAALVDSGAIALSVLTQPYLFDGSIEYLASIRKRVNVPILMKDIVVSQVQIDAAKKTGADFVLLIKSVFDRNLAEGSLEKLTEYAVNKGLDVLIEAHSGIEFSELLQSRHRLVGINNRNLDTLEVDISNTERLLSEYGKGKSLIISESGITEPSQITYLHKAGADAFLVGTGIMQSDNPGSKVKELSSVW